MAYAQLFAHTTFVIDRFRLTGLEGQLQQVVVRDRSPPLPSESQTLSEIGIAIRRDLVALCERLSLDHDPSIRAVHRRIAVILIASIYVCRQD